MLSELLSLDNIGFPLTGKTRDEITRERYGVTDTKNRYFRYGVQVNSLGLTEPQPENNVYRILLEMLAVTLSKNARARAVQLPAWNEALGLPRPWDQQWSLRMQQILAYETDLLDYGKINTTETKAKEVRGLAEKMITLGKEGGLSSRRKALSFIIDKKITEKVFAELAPRYAERPGGYTRITKLGQRLGDGAAMVQLELI